MPKDDRWKEKYKNPVTPNPERIHELPRTWCWATFDQIGDRVTVGHVGSMKNEYIDEGIPFLRSQNVRENRFDSKGLKFISEKFHEQLKKSSLEPGDIVTVRSGSVGVTCVIPDHLRVANCSDLVIVKQPKAVMPKLAAYYMNTITQTKVAAEKVGVALTHFNTKSMAKMPLPVPNLLEQETIVELLDQKLSEIEKLDIAADEQMVKSEKSKQSILAAAFSGKLVKTSDEDTPAVDLLSGIQKTRKKPVTTSQRGKIGKQQKRGAIMRKPVIDILKEKSDEIETSVLMQKAGYDVTEVEAFYSELGNITELVEEVRPNREAAKRWPYEESISLRLRK